MQIPVFQDLNMGVPANKISQRFPQLEIHVHLDIVYRPYPLEDVLGHLLYKIPVPSIFLFDVPVLYSCARKGGIVILVGGEEHYIPEVFETFVLRELK